MNSWVFTELLTICEKWLTELHSPSRSTAYTQGIFQSIGFKEFHAYLTLKDVERETEAGKKLLDEGVSALKSVTKRYARKQIKWIKNRFIRTKNREVPDIYGLDATDLDTWDENVLKPAVEVVGSRLGLTGYSSVLEPLPREDPIETAAQENHCAICDRIFTDTLQWSVHLKSNKHQRMVKKRKREEAQEEARKKLKENPDENDSADKISVE